MTKGYIRPFEPYEPVTENTLVGCRRCHATWYEVMTQYNGCRINGPMYNYDYCSECIQPTDPQPTEENQP